MNNTHLSLRVWGRIGWLLALLVLGSGFTVMLAQAAPPPHTPTRPRAGGPPLGKPATLKPPLRPIPQEDVAPGQEPASVFFIATTILTGQGNIFPGGIQLVNPGGSITFTIVPDPNYDVQNVWVDDVPQGPITTYAFLNVTANHSLAASFAPITYIITPTAGANGSISPATPQAVAQGAAHTFTITPDASYCVLDVRVNDVSQGPVSSYTFVNVTQNMTIAATFTNQFVITPTDDGVGGHFAPNAPQNVPCGGSQTFNVVEFSGYHATGIYVDGVLQPPPWLSYTFVNITASHIISVVFEDNFYTITPTVVGGGGFIIPGAVQSIAYQSAITFFVVPNANHRILDVGVDGVSQGPVSSYVFTQVAANHTISALFGLDTFLITPTVGAGGSITPNTPQAVPYNDSQTFFIVPNPGKVITDVVVDGVSQGPLTNYTFNNVSATHTIHAVFDDDTYLMTVWPTTNGSITPGTHIAPRGASVTFTLTPNTGYHVANVWADGMAQGPLNTYVFTNVVAPHQISATFAINTYNITAAGVGTGGGVFPNGVQTYTHGTAQEYQVVANANYFISGVWVDGVAQAVPGETTVFIYPFSSITANHTLTATFAPVTYAIVAAVGPSGWGTITPSGTQFVPHGENITYTISPGFCFTLETVYVDGFPVPPATTYTFNNVADNHTLTATFASRGFRITPIAIGNGTITPSQWITAYYGSTYPFTITPNIGHYIAAMTVTTGTVIPNPTGMVYTFTNICDNQFIVANFAIHTYNITATASSGGAISSAGVNTVTYGSNKIFTITPNLYYHIENLWIDGVLQPHNQVGLTYTFANITAHHTLSATFAPDAATLYVNVVNSDTVVHGRVGFPGGVNCSGFCAVPYLGAPTVMITAAVNDGKFLGWGGACSGRVITCALQMVTTRTVTAYFGLYRTYFPFMAKSPPCRIEISETEPNNSMVEALSQGTLCSGQTYQPRPNDYQDWLYFDIPNGAPGPVAITMTNNSGWGGQLQLRDSNNNLLAYSSGPGVFQITCASYVNPNCIPSTPFPPGRYYIVVYVNNNYSSTPYNLTVTYPSPAAP